MPGRGKKEVERTSRADAVKRWQGAKAFMKKNLALIVYVLIGLLMPIPINLLQNYLATLEKPIFTIPVATVESLLVYLAFLLLGVYAALLRNIWSIGTARVLRVRWPIFALGAVFFVLGTLMKLEQATGLITSMDFVRGSDLLMSFFRFNDGLYFWVVLAGFFLTDAFEKVPVTEEARVVGTSGETKQPEAAAPEQAAVSAETKPEDAGHGG
jgi:hypothetical protein